MYRNLTDFIDRLEREGELRRVAAPVDPSLEIAEITDRMAKSPGGGKALLFENTGTGFPVLTNMFGSDRRIAMALGVESLDELTARIDALLGAATAPKENLWDKLRMLPLLGEMSRWMPRTVKRRGECQQVILTGVEASLGDLPVLKCWPHDGGRFVTLPLVNTRDPETGARNVGMYRMQVFSERETGMHWHVHKTGERHYRAYRERGERMPVSVCLGGDPAYTYAATAPMPDNLDEYLLAGFLRRRPVKLVKCITNDLWVPSDCDFVIEGYVDPAEEKRTEGPFGDHTGFYSLEDLYPIFHVTAITHRHGAVYPATIVGIPPQEDAYIAKATEKIFLAPIRFALQPEVEDLWMPEEGVAHNIAVVKIRPSYAGQAFKVASSMWGAGQMMFNKFLLVTSGAEVIRDPETLAAKIRAMRIPEDLFFSQGILDVLDHATATPGVGGKLALDLTGEDSEQGIPAPGQYTPELSGLFTRIPGIVSADTSLAAQWQALVLRCSPETTVTPKEMAAFLQSHNIEGIRFIILADAATAHLTHGQLLWHAAGNTDPGRDIRISCGIVVIDARSKHQNRRQNESPSRNEVPRGGYRTAGAARSGCGDATDSAIPGNYPFRWPNPVTADPRTIAEVDRRWPEYGLGERLASPSLQYIPLLLSDKAQA